MVVPSGPCEMMLKGQGEELCRGFREVVRHALVGEKRQT